MKRQDRREPTVPRETGDRVARRLAELRAAYGLDDTALAALQGLLDALAGEHAPTTVRDPAQGVDVHVADSLVALELEAFAGARVIADLGAGAGVPGLVLAAARPAARVVLVESVARKGDFIEAAAERMGVANAEVVRVRAEEWLEGREACDVVTARALASLPVLVEYAAPLLRVGGTLVAWKGAVTADEATDGAAAAAMTGLREEEIRPVEPFRGSSHRTLYVYSKVTETPARFPRRAGIAAKRPLSAKT